MTTTYDPGGVTVSIGKSQTVQLALRIFRVRLTGLLFETDKTFLLPIAMHGIRGLVEYYQNHPNAKLVVTGHTDTVGDAAYNLALSDERAASVAHYLSDDVDPWLACYQGSPHSKTWGTREDQHMLGAVEDDDGAPFYAGPVHGQLDAPTRDAVTRFQTARGLTVDGQPGPETRRALCTDYMKLDGTTLPPTATLERLGCGENHPEVPTPDGTDEPANRRVEIFLFDGPPEPPNPGKCPGGGCAYPEWKKRAEEIVDFDHDLCELLVQCHDDDAQPLADALVRLTRDGGDQRELPTNAQGQAFFQNLLGGQYQVRGEKKGFSTEVRTVQVVSGGVAEESDQPAVQKKSFASDTSEGAAPPASAGGNPPVNLQLDKELAVIEIVGEKPSDLTIGVKEGQPNKLHASAWQRLESTLHSGAGDEPLRFDVQGKAFPFIESPPANLTRIGVQKPHRVPVQYRIWDEAGKKVLKEPAVVPGTTLKVQLSTRLRLSVFHFFPPFISITQANTLDTDLLDLLEKSRIDDISLVSVVKFVDDKANPRVELISGFWPWKPTKADYLRKLLAACRKIGVQLVVGWAAVDEKAAIQNKPLVDFLATAPDDKVQTLAKNIATFFFDELQLDIDGFMFDFELNGLGPPNDMPADPAQRATVEARVARQAENLRNLYRLTAAAISSRKADAFVSYCNAPFTGDKKSAIAFMQLQGFDLLTDCPNLVARPMCFDEHTVPASTIRTSVRFAVADGNDPAQLQYGVFARELPNDFGALLTDTFRANRVGVVLYQFPGVPAEKVNKTGKSPDEIAKAEQAANRKAAAASRVAQLQFLKDVVAWNDLLNPEETTPQDRTPGQPLQVPRGGP